jgi:hypothetical protein
LALRKRTSTDESDPPVLSIFMEDEFGRPISKGVRRSLCSDAAAFWEDMVRAGETPTTFCKTGLARKEEFRACLEDKYHWLRLCDGHWKVNQLWINYFTGWKNRRFPKDGPPVATNKNSKAPAIPDGHDTGPFTMIDTPDSKDSTASKREREDHMDAVSSKRYKGKQSEQTVSRPLQKKLSTKVVKVCMLLLLFDEYLLKDV